MRKTGQIICFFVRKSLTLSKKQLRKSSTIVSYGGYAISVAILTAALTLLNGYQRTLKENLLGVNAHVYIYSLMDNRLNPEEVIKISHFLDLREEVDTFAPVIMTQLMAAGERQIKGVLARNIEWEREQLPINYHRYVTTGSSDLKQENDAVIGSELADFLQVGLNQEIDLITPLNMQYTLFGLKTGEVSVRVKGIFHSGLYEADSRTIFLNKQMFAALTSFPDRYDLVEVKLKEDYIDRADLLTGLWTSLLDNDFIINSWIDYNSNLFTMLVLQRWVIGIILSFLVLIASFNIISNTTTSILEQKKEIGILKAIGSSDSLLRSFFLIKTAILSIIAVIAGISGGIFLALLLTKQSFLMIKGDVYFIENFTIRPEFSTILITLLISVSIALWATIISLRKISQLTVIDVIRSS